MPVRYCAMEHSVMPRFGRPSSALIPTLVATPMPSIGCSGPEGLGDRRVTARPQILQMTPNDDPKRRMARHAPATWMSA